MKYLIKSALLASTLSVGLLACQQEEEIQQTPSEETVDQQLDQAAALTEAEQIINLANKDAGIATDDLNARRVRFTKEENVFLKSALAVDNLEDPNLANVTLPLFQGVGPSGEPTYFIVTEAANFYVAKLLGLNYSPKLVFGRDTEGSQEVTLRGGRIVFKGDVDFSPERRLEAGSPNAFPPAVAEPGAIGDEEYSSLVVLPSGSVINAQIVANATGLHDRAVSIDKQRRTITMQLLDGFQGGDQFYYHLVTDASDPVPAAIELGVFAPRLAKLPSFGESSVFDQSALLGFSPVINGPTGADNPERQGLGSTIVDDDLDPINIFPLDPANDEQFFNNYSPMWDAHLNMWTQEAIDAGLRRRITSFEDLQSLVDEGLVMSFEGSPGIENGFVAGLNASNAIINCPVIAQPFESANDEEGGSFDF